MQIVDNIDQFITQLESIDWSHITSWLPDTFAAAVISIVGVLIALRVLEAL